VKTATQESSTMLDFAPPLREQRFVLENVLRAPELWRQWDAFAQIEAADATAVLEAAARFAVGRLLPLAASGDREGCRREGDQVETPSGWPEAYRDYVAAGWPSLTVPANLGGQGFPRALGALATENLAAANLAFSIFANVREGVLACLARFASADVLSMFAPHLASGQWSGTMCLTEPQAGSDLGLVKTVAMQDATGSWRVSGQKCFISNGEHDLTPNIVHLVLARTPDAPAGTKGISLFVVSRQRLIDGQLGERNGVSLIGLEHKHGIRANATCALAFEGSHAFLVGELGQGLRCMFLLMNAARLEVGVQCVGLAEIAYQNALQHARTRLQGRALGGAAQPQLPADPIISHSLVRRSLLAHRQFIDGARALVAWVGLLLDQERHHPDPDECRRSGDLAALLTPVVKGYLSDRAAEHIGAAQRLFGGSGYIVETGMEQLVRDQAICRLYEGSNEIQALDLLGRKVLADQGARLKLLGALFSETAHQVEQHPRLSPLAAWLRSCAEEVAAVAAHLGVDALFKRETAGHAAPAFLELLGHCVMGWMQARIALAAASGSDTWHINKVAMALDFVGAIQPRITSLLLVLRGNGESLSRLEAVDFSAL
jgi:alkylation response protein AidB-like acyl-CoA dehydrogenase